MVDCSKRLNKVDVCEGSTDAMIPRFIHNLGLVLRSSYPHVGREQRCRYSESLGCSPIALNYYVKILVTRLAGYIEYRPLYAGFAKGPTFDDHRGEMHYGQGCAVVPNHAMVVVGHGREDGQEFWLMRHSYASSWCEQGNYKLAKSAPERCIKNRFGYAFGSADGR